MDHVRPPADPRQQSDGAVSLPISSTVPAVTASPAPLADDGASTLRRKSKWDEAPPDMGLPPPPVVPPARPNQKVLKLEAVQIRTLIGKGGETIKSLRAETGSDIRIEHVHSEPEGTVIIIGDIERTENVIKDHLASKGCPLNPMLGVSNQVGFMHNVGNPEPFFRVEAQPPGPESLFDVTIAQELVGMLIGPGGSHLQDVRAKAGDNVSISVLPPVHAMAPQIVRVEGEVQESRKVASDLIRERILVLKQNNPQGRIPTMPFRISPPGSLPTGLTPAAALLEGGALTRSLPKPPGPAQPQAMGAMGAGQHARMMSGPRPTPAISGLAPLPPPPGPPPRPVGVGQQLPGGAAQPMAMHGIPAMQQASPVPSAAPAGLGEEDWLMKAARQAAEKLQDKQPAPQQQMMQPLPGVQPQMMQQPAPMPAAATDLQAAGMQGLAALVAAQNNTL